jgi:hypothetical protein
LGLLLRYSFGQMRFVAALACFVCLARGFAQTPATLDALRYPPLAAAAQVQGDVLVSGGIVVTGHPLLREAALRGIDLLNVRAPQTGVLFHFMLVKPIESTRTETTNRGDGLDRFFLRLLRISTVNRRAIYECIESSNVPANRIDSTKDPIEVWAYGKGHCLMVQTGTLERS